jgi:hypothetical protein
MAQVTTIKLLDDVDGSPADETVDFALDGRSYEIDLSESNADKLRGLLADFVASARRARGASAPKAKASSAPSGRDRDQTRAIRTWAKASGYDISDRGRIPANIIDEYNESGGVVSKAQFSDPDPVPALPWNKLDPMRRSEVKAWAANLGIEPKAWTMNSKFRDKMSELCLNNDEKTAKALFDAE